MSEKMKQLTSESLVAFAEEYLLPVIRYTANKRKYVRKQSKNCPGMDRYDFDQWAEARSKIALEKLDEMSRAATGKGVEGE